MKAFLIFLIIFAFIPISFADEISTERDPFKMSQELLSKTLSGRYVSFSQEDLRIFNLPRIEVTGVMIVGDRVMAVAEVESVGTVILKPGQKVTGKISASKEREVSFVVEEITQNELVIILENGHRIRGQFR